MTKKSKIYIAGHNGLVGSAIVRKLQTDGYKNILFRDSQDLDLRNAKSVTDFFEKEKPEYVFVVAGTVGAASDALYSPIDMIPFVSGLTFHGRFAQFCFGSLTPLCR